jgi:hypothetical protein
MKPNFGELGGQNPNLTSQNPNNFQNYQNTPKIKGSPNEPKISGIDHPHTNMSLFKFHDIWS